MVEESELQVDEVEQLDAKVGIVSPLEEMQRRIAADMKGETLERYPGLIIGD